MNFAKKSAFLAATALSAAYAMPAFAQDEAADSEANDKEIVVTGTLIRGIAPGGSQSIAVSSEKITEIGAANTSDLVSAIPQAGTFNQYVGVRGSSNFSLAVNRPSLRYLGFTSSSTASTLLLVDGHRLPGMGILQSSADVDAIPAGAIERVEVVTDGGSSTYGSDAVGGVMNFITRKTFNGVEIKGNYGFGEDYQVANISATVGKAWDNGSAYISYDFTHHDELFGADRGWSRSLNWPLSTPGNDVGSAVNCTVPNILYGTRRYGLSGPNGNATSTINRCDNTEFSTFYPRETKHSVMGSFYLDQGSWELQVKAYYVNRRGESDAGPLTADVAIAANNPYYRTVINPATGLPETGTQTAQISLGAIPSLAGIPLGNSTKTPGLMESWGITPSAKFDLGSDWQLNAMFNYGRGKNTFIGRVLNATPLRGVASTFDPYNLSNPANIGVLSTALDFFQAGRAVHHLVNARVIADGPLAKMPGGDLKVAIGAEYIQERYKGFTSRGITAAALAAQSDFAVKRDVWSVFGEVNVPIVGADNRGGIYGLSLTASGRYDHYSDFGNTFNPKFGINFEPVEWLRLRGNWSKSFTAPGVSDLAQILIGESANALPTSLRPFFDPDTPRLAGHDGFLLTIGGTKPNLQPQKATTWSLGFDIKPAGSNFEAGMTYYNIDFKGAITIAPINLPTFYKNFANQVVLYTANGGGAAGELAMSNYFNSLVANVPAAQVANALATVGGNCTGAACFTNVYAVMDGRTTNQSVVKTSGLDFYVRYRHETGFGDIYADIAGNYILTLKNGGPTGVLSTNGIDPNHKFSMAATLGAHIGNLQAQVTWQTNDGFDVTPNAGNLNQSRVKGFNVFNLFFKYDVPGDSFIAKDLTFTLNVDNVFNTDPPLLRGLSNSLFGAGNGFTLGRVVKIGVAKKFW